MRVTSVSYSRVKNLGNYENERVTLEAELGPDETPGEALDELREEAEIWLNPPPSYADPDDDDEPPV